MAKGAVLDEALMQALGLSDQLFTLAGPIVNAAHAQLGEPMFHLRLKELDAVVHLERSYVFTNQVSLKASLGDGDRMLLWTARQSRPIPGDTAGGTVSLLLARECFLLGDWREFQRFKGFIKSMRILDAQARQWLEDHHREFPRLATEPEGMDRVLATLARIADWPDLESAAIGEHVNVLERIAKTYSADLAPVRASPLLPALLLRRDAQDRFTLFRLFSYVEDPAGSRSLLRFLTELAATSRDPAAIEATAKLTSGRELSRAFTALRRMLLRTA